MDASGHFIREMKGEPDTRGKRVDTCGFRIKGVGISSSTPAATLLGAAPSCTPDRKLLFPTEPLVGFVQRSSKSRVTRALQTHLRRGDLLDLRLGVAGVVIG